MGCHPGMEQYLGPASEGRQRQKENTLNPSNIQENPSNMQENPSNIEENPSNAGKS